MLGVRQMHPDLVRASRKEAHLEQAELGAALSHPHARARLPAVLAHADAALAGGGYIFVQRLAQFESVLGRRALHDGAVKFLDLALAQHAVELDERSSFLCHHQ